MTRTLNEIKKGLECYLDPEGCNDRKCNAERCPYAPDYLPSDITCADRMLEDAFALIQKLQADNAQQARCIENMTDKLNAMNDEVEQLQAERNAMIEELKNAYSCFACKKFHRNGGECKAGGVCMMRDFEWRGVQKEDGNEKT